MDLESYIYIFNNSLEILQSIFPDFIFSLTFKFNARVSWLLLENQTPINMITIKLILCFTGEAYIMTGNAQPTEPSGKIFRLLDPHRYIK